MGNAVTKIHYELTKEADFVLSVYYIKAISPCKMTKEVNNWSKFFYFPLGKDGNLFLMK